KGDLVALIERARAERESARSTAGADAIVCARPHEGARFASFDIDRFRGYTRAFLKIQDGCDRSCAYCAVPGARGPARSRNLAEVVEQARRLAANGYRELVLTGVHIGAYGEGAGEPRLSDLIEALLAVEGLSRVRLGSVEPTELSDSLVDTIISNPRVARHLHVPLQSGSDRILSSMRRGYTADEYAGAVRRVADREPALGLGADVIVGFPGETDEDFADTLSLVKELPMTYLHVFSFSPRPGTEAATMPDDVPGPEKKRRSGALRALGRRKSRAFRTRLIGTEQEILLEHGSESEGTVSGLSGNYVRVQVDGGRDLCNRLLRVRVTGADDSRTWGAVVGSEL
ncbi:MAG: MiaB/RimO family radical SAM methylthiotransferase, partial [Candidatus Eisenbacteria bacterium]|nr:MiaB/RimO family radical SAM methylthiotransferase [Candidatus Eisenbacteria bacterium]